MKSDEIFVVSIGYGEWEVVETIVFCTLDIKLARSWAERFMKLWEIQSDRKSREVVGEDDPCYRYLGYYYVEYGGFVNIRKLNFR